jgi:hypothetical protein
VDISEFGTYRKDFRRQIASHVAAKPQLPFF